MVNFEKEQVVFARFKGRCFWPAIVKTYNKKSDSYEVEFIDKDNSIRETKQSTDLLQFEVMLDKFKNSKQQGIEQAIQKALEFIVISQENCKDTKTKKTDLTTQLGAKNLRSSRTRSESIVEPEKDQKAQGKKRKAEEKKDEISPVKKRKVDEEDQEEVILEKSRTKKQAKKQQQLDEDYSQQANSPVSKSQKAKQNQQETQQELIIPARSSARKKRLTEKAESALLDSSPAKNLSMKQQLTQEKNVTKQKEVDDEFKPTGKRSVTPKKIDEKTSNFDCSSPMKTTSRMTTRVTNSQKKSKPEIEEQKKQPVRASSRQRKTTTQLAEQESPEFGRKSDDYYEEHEQNSLSKSLFNTLFRPVFDTKSKSDSPFGFNLKNNNPFQSILGDDNGLKKNSKSQNRNRSNSKKKQQSELNEEKQVQINSSSFRNQDTKNNTNCSVRQVLQFENSSQPLPQRQEQQSQQNQLSPILGKSNSSGLQSPFDAPSFFSDFLANNFNFNGNNSLDNSNHNSLNNSQNQNIFNKEFINEMSSPCSYFTQQSSFPSPIALSSTSSHKIHMPSPNKPLSALNISNNSSFKFSPSPVVQQSEPEDLRDNSIERALRERIIPMLEGKLKNRNSYGQDNEQDLWLCDIVDVVRQIKSVSVEHLVRGEIPMLLEQVYDGLLNIQDHNKRNFQYVLNLLQRTIGDLDRKIIAHLHDYSRLRGEKYKFTRDRQNEENTIFKKSLPTFIKIEDKDDDEECQQSQQLIETANSLQEQSGDANRKGNQLLTNNNDDLSLSSINQSQQEQCYFFDGLERNEKQQQLFSARKLKEEVQI